MLKTSKIAISLPTEDFNKIEKKSIFNKVKDALSSFYWGFRYNLWSFLLKSHLIKK